VNVDWGNGDTETITAAGQYTKDYTSLPGQKYTIRISGTADVFGSDGTTYDFNTWNNMPALTKVVSFGKLGITDLSYAFSGSDELINVPANLPNTVTKLEGTFYGCESLKDPNLSKWDVSRVTTMYSLFEDADDFDEDLSSWDVSKVTNMANMFYSVSSQTLCAF